MSAWIATRDHLPEPRTSVLVAVQYGDAPAVAYHTGDIWKVDTEHYEVSCGVYCQGGTPCTPDAFVVTHWMPLPKLPEGV